VDVRLSPEQVALRDAAAVVIRRLGPRAVADLDDAARAAKLRAAVEASGWLELRAASEGGRPVASAVEVAVVAEELGGGLADAAFVGPTLAAELRRAAGAAPSAVVETVVLRDDLAAPACARDGVLAVPGVALDGKDAVRALVLVPGAAGTTLGQVEQPHAVGGADLTRPARRCPAGLAVRALEGRSNPLGEDDLARWHALGLAATCGDLVGVMRGALALATDYARTRQQYGAPIGSFQAVQHLLADSLVATEGSRSIALHAAWAVDALPGSDALAAASAAKAYCARAARGVCETAVQVHGGIGNTWECLAHVYLRRALVSGEILGGVGANLGRVLAAHGVGGTNGLR
jgi:hypothetical protein